MKLRLTVILAATLAASLVCRADYLEVRRAALIKFDPAGDAGPIRRGVIGELLPLEDDDQTNGYYEVRLGDSQTGWIYRTLVRRHPGDIPTEDDEGEIPFPLEDLDLDDYYSVVDDSNADTLRLTLHNLIDDHVRYRYTDDGTDTWDILEQADEDPNDSDRVLDLYRNASYLKVGGGNNNYQREHVWPKSFGFKLDRVSNYPFTDCHHLFICDGGYNGSRSNKPFDTVSENTGKRKPTVETNGVGGTDDESNWTEGNKKDGSLQVWPGRRGDVARAIFYMDVRYEGGTHSETGADEPDLIVTGDRSLIVSTNTNRDVGHMAMLSVLLQWHADDPVDEDEQFRNDIVYQYQGNRNPFIDQPEWVTMLFGTPN